MPFVGLKGHQASSRSDVVSLLIFLPRQQNRVKCQLSPSKRLTFKKSSKYCYPGKKLLESSTVHRYVLHHSASMSIVAHRCSPRMHSEVLSACFHLSLSNSCPLKLSIFIGTTAHHHDANDFEILS